MLNLLYYNIKVKKEKKNTNKLYTFIISKLKQNWNYFYTRYEHVTNYMYDLKQDYTW